MRVSSGVAPLARRTVSGVLVSEHHGCDDTSTNIEGTIIANAFAKVATWGAKARLLSEHPIVANELRKSGRRAGKAQQSCEITDVGTWIDGGEWHAYTLAD